MNIDPRLKLYYEIAIAPKSSPCSTRDCCKEKFCNSPLKCCSVWERKDLSDHDIKYITSYIRNIKFDKFIIIFNDIKLIDVFCLNG